ncbi:trypsin-like peptidase domain-containing protein [Rhabdothermincola salaria]|uniref:trypsin-like peptidase domain-containing protein n=1 Tax=Rhabdothermincola salaria TaxID=2903142 RepID=UPI001E5D94B6|nr:trypsin-like peptidase domain-containing protein [Rhabdothermincola salaria]MCD9624343.1 S1C family serine protease [Rhabdothermincola salaria]
MTAVACGGGGGSGAVGSVDDVESATIRITTEGSLRDPEVGFATETGTGSGFFIDDQGLAVTNNHVVTGAGTLEVFIGDDDSQGYNAQVVGVSECNDLALIQVDVEESTPYLEWYDEEISTGLDVYAAGFPLGDPEFTLTRGIVAKAQADGDLTGTSSIDRTIEHDANIQPGNSGGPLVDESGKVVAVNYAGGAVTDTAQFFAIAADLATEVVDQLQEGDMESIGVNGWSVDDEETGLTGIWVAGVAPGSPAATAALLPGDIITSLNGVPMGEDGTFRAYCDVLRTAGGGAIAVEALRFDSEEVLRGEINGSKALEAAYSFAREVEEEAQLSEGASYTSYVTITDDTGTLTVDVPTEWADVLTSPLTADDGGPIPVVAASPDLQSFETSYSTPGMVFVAGETLVSPGEALAEFAPAPGECVDAGVSEYADDRFSGLFQIWDQCGPNGAAFVVLVTEAAEFPGFTFVVAVQAVTEADLGVIDEVFATFNVVG